MIVKTSDVLCFEAAGNYVKIFCSDSSNHLVYKTLNKFETQLDPKQFIRVNRSVILNTEYLQEMQPYFSGERMITLKSGKKIKLSRNYKNKLHELMGHY